MHAFITDKAYKSLSYRCHTKHILSRLYVFFLLGNSPASEFYMPTFPNTLSVPSSQADRYEEYLPAYEDGTERMFRNVGI